MDELATTPPPADEASASTDKCSGARVGCCEQGWRRRLGGEAARALNVALTLIERSDHALVLNVDSGLHEQSTAMLSRIAERLRRHCPSADFAQIEAAPKAVADVLLARAGEMGADLIVAGAYSHSRLKERLFGGVTRSLLERTRFPLLMSH